MNKSEFEKCMKELQSHCLQQVTSIDESELDEYTFYLTKNEEYTETITFRYKDTDSMVTTYTVTSDNWNNINTSISILSDSVEIYTHPRFKYSIATLFVGEKSVSTFPIFHLTSFI